MLEDFRLESQMFKKKLINKFSNIMKDIQPKLFFFLIQKINNQKSTSNKEKITIHYRNQMNKNNLKQKKILINLISVKPKDEKEEKKGKKLISYYKT